MHSRTVLCSSGARARALLNRFSFRYIDAVMWMGLAPTINSFRRSLGLRTLQVGWRRCSDWSIGVPVSRHSSGVVVYQGM